MCPTSSATQLSNSSREHFVEAIVLGSALEIATIRSFFRGHYTVSSTSDSIKYLFGSVEEALDFIERSKQVIRDMYSETSRGPHDENTFQVDLYDTYYFETIEAAREFHTNELNLEGEIVLSKVDESTRH